MRRVVVVKNGAVVYENIDFLSKEEPFLKDCFSMEEIGSVLEVITNDVEFLGFYNVKVGEKEGFISKTFVKEIEEEFAEEEKTIIKRSLNIIKTIYKNPLAFAVLMQMDDKELSGFETLLDHIVEKLEDN